MAKSTARAKSNIKVTSDKDSAILIGANHRLTLESCNKAGRLNEKVKLDPKAYAKIESSNRILETFSKQRLPVYGLNTQFGNNANMLDANITNGSEAYQQSVKQRQLNLIISHNTGLGDDTPEDVVRVAMMLRAHCLGLGHSGVRPEIIEALLSLINAGIHPVINKYGSIGASGDLIPLAGVAAALCGQDTMVMYQGKKIPATTALKKAGLKPLVPEQREGLALINGTSFMTANAALTIYDLRRLFKQLLASIAMSLEALLIFDSPYNPFVHELKGHKGEIEINDFFIDFWKGSNLIRKLSHAREQSLKSVKNNKNAYDDSENLQNFYSLRSVPQGFGPFKENLERAISWIETEMNSVNDNPLISIKPEEIYHSANFMGYYVTEACDTLKMDIAQASTWMHAILAIMIHPNKNAGLPANLVNRPDINNGYRPLQILSASLAVQNRKLAQAQQSFMLPTEGDNQDVNSLATHAAFDLKEAYLNLERLTAIMLLASTQALEFRGIKNAAARSKNIHKTIRQVSPFLENDHSMSNDILKVIELMRSGKI
jgi:phenylalanine ammonia-lyase